MVSFLVTLLILVLVFGLIWYVLTLVPLPPPFKNVALVIVCIIMVIVLLGMLPVADGLWPARLR